MTRDQLLARLVEIRARQLPAANDEESDHADADGALLDYIADPEVTAAFDAIDKWYA